MIKIDQTNERFPKYKFHNNFYKHIFAFRKFATSLANGK